MKPRDIFDPETDADVLALAELAPDMRAVLSSLIEHINDGQNNALCGAKGFDPALLVSAALASDCEQCRTTDGVGNMKDHKQRAVVEWESQPMEGAETVLADKLSRSDGR